MRRLNGFLFAVFFFPLLLSAQNWNGIIDVSRAIDWTQGVGFTIPNYTTNCSNQPALLTGSGNAAANSNAIRKALASCDATHNVVNIPTGTYYVAGIAFGTQGKQVLRGAGPMSTTLISTSEDGCGGAAAGLCMISASPVYNGSGAVMPPSGSQQCSWTAGYAQGTTTITLSACGGAPPANHLIILDQANDTTDTSGVYVCDTNIANCGYEGSSGGNNNGRFISGKTHSQQQVASVTSVKSLGGGSYSVTISPGVYFTNVRSSQSPGAWWSDMVQNVGLENLTFDGSQDADHTVVMYDCYQCWVKNVRSENAGRAHVFLYQSANDVVRDNYFYQSQSHYSESYVVESEESSAFLVENNIFQQVTNPLMFGQGSGAVVGYNFSIDDIYTGSASFAAAAYSVHNAGNEMNLFEGNNFLGIWADDAWGSSTQASYFRNMLIGWQSGKTDATLPIIMRANIRAFNVVGNVMGQPGYHTQYQAYATSGSSGTGGSAENTSIYSLGWAYTGPACSGGAMTTCDPKTFSTLMRWGNYDVVTSGTKWDSTEASPAAVPYVNANFSSAYFGSLAHTLPASFYYNSEPSWWPTAKPWPPVGPDVSSGNLGICSGTYSGAQATSPSQCNGGKLTAAWAGHANSIPAQDCYLNIMGGPPDGSGGMLSFDANVCYSEDPPQPPSGLTAAPH